MFTLKGREIASIFDLRHGPEVSEKRKYRELIGGFIAVAITSACLGAALDRIILSSLVTAPYQLQVHRQ